MQAKDISDESILKYLAEHQGKWTMRWHCKDAVAPNAPEKVFLAKMKRIIARGLSRGCDCGCRGDYEITDKGLALIGQKRTHPYSGY
jgi:hypothetical protein